MKTGNTPPAWLTLRHQQVLICHLQGAGTVLQAVDTGVNTTHLHPDGALTIVTAERPRRECLPRPREKEMTCRLRAWIQNRASPVPGSYLDAGWNKWGPWGVQPWGGEGPRRKSWARVTVKGKMPEEALKLPFLLWIPLCLSGDSINLRDQVPLRTHFAAYPFWAESSARDIWARHENDSSLGKHFRL